MRVHAEKLDAINISINCILSEANIAEKIASFEKEEKTEENTLKEKAQGELLKECVTTALKQLNVAIDSVLGQPYLRSFKQTKNGTEVEMLVALDPKLETETLSAYTDSVPTFQRPIATEEEIEEKTRRLAKNFAPFEIVKEDRKLKEGDIAVIDFEGFIDNKPFEGGKAEKFKLKIGSNTFIPGFETQLVGMKKGEEKVIEVTFPKNYQAPDLAGKEAVFHIKLHAIEQQMPSAPVDDELAKKALNDPKANLQILRKRLKEQIENVKLVELYTHTLKPKLIEALTKRFDFILPQNIVEQEIDGLLQQHLQNLNEEEQKKLAQDPQAFQALRESFRKNAQQNVKTALIVEALAKKEGIQADEQEIMAALYHQAMMSGQDPNALVEFYQKNNLMESAKLRLKEDKLFGKMLGLDTKSS